MITPDTPITSLRPAEWRANYILRPDLRVLTQSIRSGWLAPIVVRQEDSVIIDGFARWLVAGSDAVVRARDDDKVPTLWVDVDLIDAMLMHIRLNRGRGQLFAKGVSNIVRQILRSAKYDRSDLKAMLGMSDDELELLSDGSLFKARKLADHKYSTAWVPVERPADAPTTAIAIERPPNKDR